MVASTELTLST